MTIRPLIPELEAIARDELNETPQTIQDGLKTINEFLDERPYINARRDEQFLIIFLRGCKFDTEKVKEKIESYYKVRTQIPDFFKGRDTADKRYKDILKIGAVLPFPTTETVAGPRTLIVRFTSFNPKEYKIDDVIRTIGIVTEIMSMEDDNFVVAGEILVIDLANAGFQHLMQLSPTLIKKLATMSQGGNPIRCLGIHFVNTPRGFDTLLNLYKSFLSAESVTPMKVHKKVESLQTELPKSILPKEYGGESESIEEISNRWIAKLDDYQEYFREESNYGYDEKLAKEHKKK